MTDYHRHSRRRVVGLVLAACVLTGGLGAVGGVAFDPEPTQDTKVDRTPQLGVVASAGDAAPRSRAARALPSGPARLDGATQDPNLTGTTYDIGYDALVFVPSDWQVYQKYDTRIWAMNGKGSFAFAAVGAFNDASVRAGSVIQQNLTGLLPPDTYTQLRTAEIDTDVWEMPYGDVVDFAELTYEALWADPQGSVLIHGQIYAGVRKDGAVLIVLIEHVPPEDWSATLYPRAAVVEQTFLRFAHLV